MSRPFRQALTLAGTLAASLAIPGGADDFRLDWLASRAIWRGGDPYAPFAGFTHVRTPSAHLLQLPYGLVPDGWELFAAAVMVAAGATVLVWVVAPGWWWAAPIVMLLWPFSQVDRHGHPTFWWTVLLVVGFRQVVGRPWLAGLCVAAATSFRLFPWVVILGLVVARRREAVWALGWFAALNLAGLLLPGVTLDGTVVALSEGAGRFLSHPDNLSASRYLPVWALLVPVPAFAWWARGEDWRTVWNVSVVVSLAVAPLLWATYLPTLLACTCQRRLNSPWGGGGVRWRSPPRVRR